MSQQSQQQQSQQYQWLSGKSPFTLDVLVPDERTATELVTDATQDQGVREVAFRRETDGTPHIRISLHPNAIQSFKDRVDTLTDKIQRSYESAGRRMQ